MSREREFPVRHRKGLAASPPALDGQAFTLEALSFFGAHPGEAQRFFAWSGLDAGTLRSSAADTGFALGILDYFAENLISLERFCDAASLKPGEVIRLHEGLRVRGLTSHDDA